MMDNNELKLQDLGRRIVEREVIYCVSGLMYSVGQDVCAAAKMFDEDPYEIYDLFTAKDYEQSACEFIMDEANLDALEEIADHFGYWSVELDAIGYNAYVDAFGGDEDPKDLEDWLTPATETALRSKVNSLVETTEDHRWVCNEFALDPEEREVFEHWIVTPWLAAKLAEKGEVVGEFAGMPIWGRTTTGQSISLDGVIISICQSMLKE